jgi:hypothetical protein
MMLKLPKPFVIASLESIAVIIGCFSTTDPMKIFLAFLRSLPIMPQLNQTNFLWCFGAMVDMRQTPKSAKFQGVRHGRSHLSDHETKAPMRS